MRNITIASIIVSSSTRRSNLNILLSGAGQLDNDFIYHIGISAFLNKVVFEVN